MASTRPIFPPTRERNTIPEPGPEGVIKDSFTLPTLLVFGGLAQAAVSLVLPSRYALVPLAFLLGRAVILTARDLASPAAVASRKGTVPGRVSAHLPNVSYDPQRSEKASPFSPTPADKGVVVLHLGARYNHPLGMLGPGAQEFTQQFLACSQEVVDHAKEYGCISSTMWRGDEASSNNTVLAIFYFRDMEGLDRFSHGPLHKKAWNWYNSQFVKKWGYSHIGIYHEAFWAPAGAYESIYVNMPRVLMGAGDASIKNEATGEEEWVRTVVDASTPVWRTQHSRLGKRIKQIEEAAAGI
ncbi:hypothetical protein F5144DRAFT_513840 [Chaetomium tenue]|uniref:Uncharacterized protein n=1 Tax=Chaetomium tenue TaxID=1854479 RepID=A0ACB7P2I1_9PEZI|nr:hypothetical protein F5144DRAFT_513840 [Chaetomium globosum]